MIRIGLGLVRSIQANFNRSQQSHTSHSSHQSHAPAVPRLLRARGDYQTLLSFQKAEVVYDITYRFAHKFLAKGDRTVDQMVQSARSGKQNILEGSKAAMTSKEMEIKLTNIAICLINQTNYLLDQQIKTLEKEFIEQGGVRERMTQARLSYRNRPK